MWSFLREFRTLVLIAALLSPYSIALECCDSNSNLCVVEECPSTPGIDYVCYHLTGSREGGCVQKKILQYYFDLEVGCLLYSANKTNQRRKNIMAMGLEKWRILFSQQTLEDKEFLDGLSSMDQNFVIMTTLLIEPEQVPSYFSWMRENGVPALQNPFPIELEDGTEVCTCDTDLCDSSVPPLPPTTTPGTGSSSQNGNMNSSDRISLMLNTREPRSVEGDQRSSSKSRGKNRESGRGDKPSWKSGDSGSGSQKSESISILPKSPQRNNEYDDGNRAPQSSQDTDKNVHRTTPATTKSPKKTSKSGSDEENQDQSSSSSESEEDESSEHNGNAYVYEHEDWSVSGMNLDMGNENGGAIRSGSFFLIAAGFGIILLQNLWGMKC